MNKQQIESLLKIIQCPISKGSLVFDKEKNMLYSKAARVFFPIIDGIPVLLESEAIDEEKIGLDKTVS